VALRLFLLDKSAYARGHHAPDDEDEMCLCAVTRLELLYSARSQDDYLRLEEDLTRFRDLRMDAETFAIALTAQRELATASSHRIPIPDLLIAACAQQHGAEVLHVDRHYERLTKVLSFRAVRAGG
jgi:predicted nucleic acid-binding protein